MKQLFYILLTCSLFVVGCAKETDVLPGQRSKFESFLSGTHTPKLISEVQKEASQDVDPEYYTTSGETVYRYIRNSYNVDRLARAEVAYGDRLSLTFWMYEFASKNITMYGKSLTMPYYTNDTKLRDTLTKYGLSVGAWNFEPLAVELGSTKILKGLEYALPGCRELDTVEIYMTYNMAYGTDPFGSLPKESPVAVFVTVDKVTKN